MSRIQDDEAISMVDEDWGPSPSVFPINAKDFDDGYYTDSPGESDSVDEVDSVDGLDSENRWESGSDWDFEDESLVRKPWEPKPSLAIPIEESKRIDHSLWSDSLFVREPMALLDTSLEQGLEKAFDSWQVTADEPFLPLPPLNNSIPLGGGTRPIKRYRGQKQDLKNFGVVSTTASSLTNENAIPDQDLSSVIETRLPPFADFPIRNLRVNKIYSAVLPIVQLKKRHRSEAFLSEDSLELPTADIPCCDWHKEMQSGEALSRQTPGKPALHITYRPKKRRKIGFDTFPQEVRDMVWDYAMPNHSHIRVSAGVYFDDAKKQISVAFNSPNAPSLLLSLCRDSRDAFLKSHGGILHGKRMATKMERASIASIPSSVSTFFSPATSTSSTRMAKSSVIRFNAEQNVLVLGGKFSGEENQTADPRFSTYRYKRQPKNEISGIFQDIKHIGIATCESDILSSRYLGSSYSALTYFTNIETVDFLLFKETGLNSTYERGWNFATTVPPNPAEYNYNKLSTVSYAEFESLEETKEVEFQWGSACRKWRDEVVGSPNMPSVWQHKLAPMVVTPSAASVEPRPSEGIVSTFERYSLETRAIQKLLAVGRPDRSSRPINVIGQVHTLPNFENISGIQSQFLNFDIRRSQLEEELPSEEESQVEEVIHSSKNTGLLRQTSHSQALSLNKQNWQVLIREALAT